MGWKTASDRELRQSADIREGSKGAQPPCQTAVVFDMRGLPSPRNVSSQPRSHPRPPVSPETAVAGPSRASSLASPRPTPGTAKGDGNPPHSAAAGGARRRAAVFCLTSTPRRPDFVAPEHAERPKKVQSGLRRVVPCPEGWPFTSWSGAKTGAGPPSRWGTANRGTSGVARSSTGTRSSASGSPRRRTGPGWCSPRSPRLASPSHSRLAAPDAERSVDNPSNHGDSIREITDVWPCSNCRW